MDLPQNIKQWLNDRGITDAVIENNHLGWSFNKIVIPVYDLQGNFVFNKYRRDPFNSEGPKYTYAAGATAHLFHAQAARDRGSIIICEGEMDAMRIESLGHGYVAVSGTGGAGTFRDEWVELLKDKDLYICYDNDDAGMKGAAKLLTKLNARLVVVPQAANGTPVKDITDYLQAGGSFPILLEQAKFFSYLSDPIPTMTFIKDYKEQIKKFNYHLEEILVAEHNAKREARPYFHFDFIRQLLLVAIGNLRNEIHRKQYLKAPRDDAKMQSLKQRIATAKTVPITTLYTGQLAKQGNRAVGLCPFHNESGPSFTVYLDQNRFYCFGCSSGGDAIDFVSKTKNCNFIEAVKSMTP